jgi:hypothetical protein
MPSNFARAVRSGRTHIKATIAGPSKHPFKVDATFVEESLEEYRPGGCHPVRIGDQFNRGRYEVVSKLGHGVYSTVWLVHDAK